MLYPYWKGKRKGDANDANITALFYLFVIVVFLGFFLYVLFRPSEPSSYSVLVDESNTDISSIPAYVPQMEVSPSVVASPTVSSVLVVVTATQSYPTAAYSPDEYRMTATALAPVASSTPEHYEPVLHYEPVIWFSAPEVGCPSQRICVRVPPSGG